MIPNFETFASRPALMKAGAARLAAALEDAIRRHGSACAALSGGSTPEPAYRDLATMPLDWPKITFALVDERFVSPTDTASNQALIQRTLGPAFDAGARLLPMVFTAATVAASADQADATYAPLRIDIALMGMGEDGHTASWFPGSRELGSALDLDNSRTVIAAHAPQAAGAADRLTLTRAALSRAGALMLVITGDDKRAKLESALTQHDAPVSALFNDRLPAPVVMWAP
ncbi:6-phosphogluconolactonase [Terricaulis silvestris]|uniref:6-phosphogluconolactonase n=1 Tax=Terricaulis silvestris TaxID=2686094 RepID=A0A6I6MM79_9CAUL|nr:6-phosphogluconolactonase [Terricaulis silvestris]QGZ96575.1 6-phosphogluconolactonase [Terricaulis silvestris]